MSPRDECIRTVHKSSSFHFPKTLSHCFIEGEYWVMDHRPNTLSRLNPAASELYGKWAEGKEMTTKEQKAARKSIPWFDPDFHGETLTNSDFNQDYLRKWAICKNIPLFPTLEVDYACNLDCIHCYRPQEPCLKMPLERWKSLVYELKATGMLGVVITGGEPLIWPYFKDLIEHLRNLHSAFILKTNGWNFNDSMAKFLSSHHVSEVHFSLYGESSDLHDKVTRRQGSFNRVIQALKLCRAFKIPTQISCILTRENADVAGKVAKIAKQYNAVLGVNPIVAPSAKSGIDYLSLRITPDQMKKYCQSQPEFGNRTRIIRMPGSPVCSAARSNCSIAPDGRVFPCNGFWYECKADSIATRAFEDVWINSTLLKKVRGITVDHLDRCFHCNLFSHCPRCLGLGYAETGDMTGVSPGDCLAAEYFHEMFWNALPTLDQGNGGSFSDRCY